ncbi:MAG TPA: bis(5'-nucleosyl)-tetraphosphatase [Planctomycetota bacterium]|nr:bis(5'-nucleosyl)-tetraphosphatase [Planctomycetota bacterium]
MEKSVGLVIFRESTKGRLYLLLHYRGGHWDFPKGHVENGESEHQTALRELREETGITDAEIIDGFREKVQYSFRRNGRSVRKEVVYYMARTGSPDVCLSAEHQACTWLPAKETLRRITFENSRRVLKAAEKMLAAKA